MHYFWYKWLNKWIKLELWEGQQHDTKVVCLRVLLALALLSYCDGQLAKKDYNRCSRTRYIRVFFYSTHCSPLLKSCTYITHNATRLPTDSFFSDLSLQPRLPLEAIYQTYALWCVKYWVSLKTKNIIILITTSLTLQIKIKTTHLTYLTYVSYSFA